MIKTARRSRARQSTGRVEIEISHPFVQRNTSNIELSTSCAEFAPLVRAPRTGSSSDISIVDWDDLFVAVMERLRSTVRNRLAADAGPLTDDEWLRTQSSVLECVAALDHLHTTLIHEVDRHHQLELELFDARTSLAQASIELAGARNNDDRARDLALHDSLTSLPNRNCFRERLDLLLARADPKRQAIAVICLDLDDFGSINHLHGRRLGDELLRFVGARLARAVRAEDMVSRLGDDEFGFLLMGMAGREQLTRLAAKLMTVVSAPLRIGNVELTVRPSIGIAMWPGDGATAEALLENAGNAIHRAKQHRTGYAYSDPVA